MRFFSSLLVCLLLAASAYAQAPGGNAGGGRRGGQSMNVGHFYGRVVDAKSNKGIDAASVELIQSKYDSATQGPKDVVIRAALTKSNGDFSLENLPVIGKYKIKITAINFDDYVQPVTFDIKALAQAKSTGLAPAGDQGSTGGVDASLLDAIDKDLGNIKMKGNVTQMSTVVINASPPAYKMAVDKKIFNVDKNIVATGGMASDVLKNIPSVNVDIDGNVTLRNATPQIFVDGRPTTLTMDEIPADAIESIEVMTNPSAKYDASGGGGGILNIVLKKNKKVGYNGDLRAGIDSRGRGNGGGDFNMRQGKINFFINGNLRGRKSVSTGLLNQTNFDSTGHPFYYTHQPSTNVSDGFMGFGRAGFDFFLDNRNTFTLAANYFHGNFNNYDTYNATTTYDPTNYPGYADSTNTFQELGTNKSVFQNKQGELDYKHNFAKSGHELTADVNVSHNDNTTNQLVQSYIAYPDAPTSPTLDYYYPETILSNSSSTNYNFQSDYVNPFTEKTKLEAGLRAQINDQSSQNTYNNSVDSGKTYYTNEALNNQFKYTNEVYAAYGQFASALTKDLSYQVGLRGESSTYNGTLYTNTGQETFSHNFPLSLFPSAFLSYKLTDKSSLQANYSRRVNRPNFFQLSPYVNRSDSLALSQGNPNLIPEFTSSYELNYQNDYKGGSFLATAYYKHTTNLITRNIVKELLAGDTDSSNVYTYQNATSSEVYGLDLTNRYNITKWLDFMVNVILYNSQIDAGNLAGLSNENQFSYFAKMNVNIKLPVGFSVQLNGDYQSKTIVPPNSGGGGRFGGFGAPVSTANGYIKPIGGFDFAVKKDFLKGNKASIVFNMQDVFRTRINDAVSISQYQDLEYSRLRDPQFMRLTFSYRFGKMDMSLFKKKNMKQEQDSGGNDAVGGGGTR